MNAKWFSLSALIAAAVLLLSFSGCGRNQHLESIQVQPSAGGTFFSADPALFFNFKAFGTYVHPPQTKDITAQVDWQSDNPQVVQVTSAGVVSPNVGCGRGNVFATFKDGSNLVISNSVPVTVDGPASSGCPQGGALNTLAVITSGSGQGTVLSSPAGINCGTTCSAQFSTGTTVTLTATPTSPSTFGSWANCDSPASTNPCTVVLSADRSVTVTFN
jgi:hypothetical protein